MVRSIKVMLRHSPPGGPPHGKGDPGNLRGVVPRVNNYSVINDMGNYCGNARNCWLAATSPTTRTRTRTELPGR
jgi:hypothetical protein